VAAGWDGCGEGGDLGVGEGLDHVMCDGGLCYVKGKIA
jgi:hypothetical protein